MHAQSCHVSLMMLSERFRIVIAKHRGSFFIKGTVSRDVYCFAVLNILNSTFCVCADGFQGLSNAFPHPMQVLSSYLLLWNYLLILKIYTTRKAWP
jgi:hypothetical protein